MTVSQRHAAEARAAAGLIPPPHDELPPLRKPRLCHGCETPLDPVLADLGDTLHPMCDPPQQERRRGGPSDETTARDPVPLW